MILCFKILLLFVFSFSVQAEAENPPHPHKPDTDNIQVYTKQSTDAVETLNHAVEVLRDPTKALPLPETGKVIAKVDKVLDNVTERKELPRDPTQMSGNFRQALKNLNAGSGANPNSNAAKNNPASAMPAIELAAKIMGKNKSVMLRIKDRVIQVAEGGRMSLIENQQVISIQVEKIDPNQVRISVLPYNEHLILQ